MRCNQDVKSCMKLLKNSSKCVIWPKFLMRVTRVFNGKKNYKTKTVKFYR